MTCEKDSFFLHFRFSDELKEPIDHELVLHMDRLKLAELREEVGTR